MIRSIIWYVKFVVTLILKTPKLKKVQKILSEKGQKESDEYAYPIVKNWAADRIKDSGAKIHVYNQERIPEDTNVLFVSNHQSDFDIAIFLACIKKYTGFVAKVEMENVPLLSDWMRSIHCVFLDRDNIKKSMKTILEAINLLKEGYSMVVFPEGTRSKSSNIGEFKAGSFKLATKSKVPIVPVTINGSYKILEGNRYIINPSDVYVYIHEPIYVDKLTKEEISKLPNTVYNIIKEKLK